MESTMSSYTPDQEQSPKRSTVLLTVERGQKGERMTSSELRSILDEELGKKEGLEERRKELEAVVKRDILKRASTDYDKIKYLANRCTTLKGHMSKISKEKLPNRLERPDIYTYFDNMTQLEKAFAYLRAVKFVKECSEKIEANLESGLRSEAIDIFQFLLKLKQSHVSSTECGNFRNYFNETVSYWEHCLVERFVKETQKLLDAFGWPSGLATSTPTLETHDKFRRTISCMIRLSSCSSAAAPSGISQEERLALVKDFKEPLLPIKVMVEPLKKRFKYHFFVNKITSDPTRPEWYFTQIKSWARDLIPFIRTHVEPLVLEAHLSAVADFISALSEMLIIKADSQLSSSSDQIEDTIFARILEESIIFENEMGNFLGEDLEDKKIYIPPFVSTLFSQPHVLQRWLAIERKACLEKMDEMFSSPNSWDRAVVPGPTEVEDLFMAVLRFVIDRFAHLQQQSQKVLFLKLLVDMIDDFRVRCLQTWKSRRVIEADYKDDVLIDYIIADTLRSIQTTIESWEDLPFFASISFFLGSAAENGEDGEMSGSPVNETLDADHSVSRDDPSGFSLDGDLFRQVSKDEDQGAQIGSPYQGLFSNVLKLYECLGEDILRKWCITAVKELRADILPNYARRKWHMFPPTGFEENGATVSEGVLNAIQRLKALSKGVSTGMNPDFAQIWLKRLAIQFDEMLMDTLVYPNRFTPGAFIQLRYDMEFGIFPVFADCNIPTGMFLVGMTSTLRIWEMPIGKVLLVWDALTDPSASFEAQEEVLAELELALRPSDVVKLLKTRADMNF